MRSRLAALGITLLVSALVTVPVSVPAGASTEKAQEDSTLRVAVTQEIDTLNPFQAVFLISTQVLRINYEYLTLSGAEDSSPVPGLAESWESSEDNLTWTFHIREGMQWSDGEPITAGDVAFTYNLIMENEDAAVANGVAVSNYESVEATDDHTLVIKTKQPQASILTSDVPIVPEHEWKDVTDFEAFKNSAPEDLPVVGSGAYVVTGYEEGRSVTMEANDKFWRGPPKVDTLQFIKYENSEAAVQGLIAGDVDMVFRLTPEQFNALKDQPNITTHAGNDRRYTEITLNPSNPKADGSTFGNGNPVLKDLKVRQAIDHAIDRDTIIERVKGGYAKPATQMIPPVYPDWTLDLPDDKRRDFDPDKANQLLDEAGYDQKGPDGIRLDKEGNPINLRLLGNSDRVQDEFTARYIEEWLEAVGIGVTFENKSSNQSSDDQNAGNFDMAFTGWSVSPDPDYSLAQQTCEVVGTELGDTNFCDPEYDRMYAEQQAELDEGKRQQLVQDMQLLLYEKVSAVILSYDQSLEAYRSDRFSGFQTQPDDGGVINNQSGYWGYYGAVPAGEEEVAGAQPENQQAAASEEDSGLSTGAVIGIVAGAVVLLAAAGWGLTRRRRTTADDRE